MNQLLLNILSLRYGEAKASRQVHAIAAVFTHIHDVRTNWIRLMLGKTGEMKAGGWRRDLRPKAEVPGSWNTNKL
jgi:uncharacterized damage-inducible protein DinB